jgi:hypothetical protein
VANSAFLANRAPRGAAVAVGVGFPPAASQPLFVNTTFAGNTSTTVGGGALYTFPDATVILRNGIFWGNNDSAGSPSELVIDGTAVADVSHAIVRGGYPGVSVLDQDPSFVRPPQADGPQDPGDLRLREGSPALDFGDPAFLPPDSWDLDADGDTLEAIPYDLAGAPRVQGADVDLGSYEGAVAVPISELPTPNALMSTATPNPFSEATVLTLELPRSEVVVVRLHDAVGRVVQTLHEGLVAGRTPLPVIVDGGQLPAGVYIVRAIGETFTAARPLVRR